MSLANDTESLANNTAQPPGAGQPPGAAPDADYAGAPAPPHTGDRSVDAAVASLSAVGSQPVEEQVETFTRAHQTLQDRLADIDG